MKILVTGGLGFIGSSFCHYLISSHPDAKVTNVDKIGVGANLSNLRDLEKEKRYRFVKGDIRDSKLMSGLIKESDAIVNFAAETHVDRSIADPNEFLQNNTVGTFTILARASATPFLYTSRRTMFSTERKECTRKQTNQLQSTITDLRN
jgi:dTDP-glucose 4,6-dehydratase